MGGDAGPETVVLMVDGGGEVRIRRVSRRAASLERVDALARLQLAAQRRGWSVQLDHPSDELLDLLELVGLTDVMNQASRCVPAPRRQAEAEERMTGGKEAGEGNERRPP